MQVPFLYYLSSHPSHSCLLKFFLKACVTLQVNFNLVDFVVSFPPSPVKLFLNLLSKDMLMTTCFVFLEWSHVCYEELS